MMKMDRRAGGGKSGEESRWFPYCDRFTYGGWSLTSREVVEAPEPHIVEGRKERMRRAVGRRSYGLCLVVEGLTDFGNVVGGVSVSGCVGRLLRQLQKLLLLLRKEVSVYDTNWSWPTAIVVGSENKGISDEAL